jgi:hypothetical protein
MNPDKWEKLIREFIVEMNSTNEILKDIEPYFDAWMVVLDNQDIDTVDYETFLIKECIPFNLPNCTSISLDKEKRIIRCNMNGIPYCIGKNDNMFIRKV